MKLIARAGFVRRFQHIYHIGVLLQTVSGCRFWYYLTRIPFAVYSESTARISHSNNGIIEWISGKGRHQFTLGAHLIYFSYVTIITVNKVSFEALAGRTTYTVLVVRLRRREVDPCCEEQSNRLLQLFESLQCTAGNPLWVRDGSN